MKIYTDVQEPARRHTSTRCDRCGHTLEHDPALSPFTTVTIDVGDGEDGGRIDSHDYCDRCLIDMAPLLKAAGSTAPVITGRWDDTDG